MRVQLAAVAALAILPLQLGCDFEGFAGNFQRYHEDFQYSYDMKPGAALTLDSFNGSVEVLGWEKDSIQITGTKYAGTEDDLRALKIDVETGAGGVHIRTVRPAERHNNMGAKYMIRLPHEAQLERIHSSNGSLRVEDIQGNCRLETSNGSIRFRQLTGRLDARTSNASIEGGDLQGDAVLHTSNGTIRVDNLAGALEATTSNSSIHADIRKPAPHMPIRLESSNGSIEATLSSPADNEIRAQTSNSSITLRVPDSIKAELNASTSNSSIHSDLEVATHGAQGKYSLNGDINGGGPLIQLHTSNGTIRLLRI